MAPRLKWIPVAIACGIAGSVAAQDEESEAPDLSFLEFLGSWEQDDDWFVFAGLADDEFGMAVDENVLETDDTDGADGADNKDPADAADETDDSGEASGPDQRTVSDRTDEIEAADAD